MDTPNPHEQLSDEQLETALRAEAEQLRSLPAPHSVPRVLESIRSLRPDAPAASQPTHRTTRLRRALGHSLTWLSLAAAALVAFVLWDSAPTADVPPAVRGSPALAAGQPITTPLRVPALHQMGPLLEIAPFLGDSDAPLISRKLEQPLLDEADSWKLDAERAAAAVVEPFLRSLLQLQLRPSMQGTGEAYGR